MRATFVFGRRSTSFDPNPPRAAGGAWALTEVLEGRRLFSVIGPFGDGLSGGVLFVTGNGGNDTLLVQDGPGNKVSVYKNGTLTARHPSTDVAQVCLIGNGGHDILINSTDKPGILDGGKGNDRIDGGSKHDDIYGGDGNDTISAGKGDDTIDCGGGTDEAHGGDGSDLILGRAGVNTLFGDGGDDELQGGLASDTLDGGYGADRLFGFGSADKLIGGYGGDYLDGGSGNDSFEARDYEVDTIVGGTGNDTARVDVNRPPPFGFGPPITDAWSSDVEVLVTS